MEIKQIAGDLPARIGKLADAAANEDVQNIARLIEDWHGGAETFETGGAALFGAFDGETLLGVGGTTRETGTGSPAMRMRRFYVRPDARGEGVGAALAHATIAHAIRTARLLTVNAQASPAAAPFWETMGFRPVTAPTITHICWRDG